jgi:hypothetical protein
MLKIASAQVWVHDQEIALKYWTEKVGMEVRQDITLPELGFRWLTVGPPRQDDVSIVLMAVPGPPIMDAVTREQVMEVVAKGFAGPYFSPPTTARPLTSSSRLAAWSSPRRHTKCPTASTPVSAIRPATACG